MIGLTLSIFFLLQIRNVLIKNMHEHGMHLIEILSSSSAVDLYLGNADRLNSLVQSFALDPNVAYISIMDNTGNVLAHSNPQEIGKVYQDELDRETISTAKPSIHYHQRSKKEGKFLEVCSLIIPSAGTVVEKALESEQGEGKINALGLVKIGFSLKGIGIERNKIFISSIGFIFLFIVISAVISFLLSSGITRPLDQLAVVTEIIAGGNLAVRAKIKSKDEIGKLANSFNSMAEKLQITTEELKAANLFLEQRVKERTKELEASRDELKKEFDELQRWKKTVVGRELKMVELKNEIAQLKARIGS
ncbi:MAG TPA: hypothetical protein DHV62_03355 [Elusimicrobia bacterium]|nr:hypothetical protein [Elusimicrobiota bacterium]